VAEVRVSRRLSQGTEVALHVRVGDWFSEGAAGEPVKTKTAPRSGEVVFKGLAAGDTFWIVIDGHGTAATAKPALAADKRREVPRALRGQRRPPEPAHDVTTSAADSRSARGLTDAQQAARKRSAAAKRSAATRRAKPKEAAATPAKSKGGTTAGKKG
jgi:hypothetical protein